MPLSPRPGNLIISCQPTENDSPMDNPEVITALALAAEQAGATAVRINSPEQVAAVKRRASVPVIGLWKRDGGRGPRTITPDWESARAIAGAGADVVALDGSTLAQPDEGEFATLVLRVQRELGRPVMADISTLEEGVRAARVGAALVGTTLSGYTPYSRQQQAPDLKLVADLARAVSIPVVAEGRYASPAQARTALTVGARYVVVGGAATAPDVQTRRFVQGMASEKGFWSDLAAATAWVEAVHGQEITEAARRAADAIACGGCVLIEGSGGERIAALGGSGAQPTLRVTFGAGSADVLIRITLPTALAGLMRLAQTMAGQALLDDLQCRLR